jgi:hypothetical protein
MSMLFLDHFLIFLHCTLVFAVSLILCIYGEMDKVIQGNCACIQPAISAIGLKLQENQVHHSKER